MKPEIAKEATFHWKVLSDIRADFDQVSREEAWKYYFKAFQQADDKIVWLDSFCSLFNRWLVQDAIAREFNTGQKCLDAKTYGIATQSLVELGTIISNEYQSRKNTHAKR